MKRNMKLIKEILLMIENEETQKDAIFKKYSKKEVYYHNYLIYKAGLIEGNNHLLEKDAYHENWNFPIICPTIITWSGYDFLETIRDKDF